LFKKSYQQVINKLSTIDKYGIIFMQSDILKTLCGVVKKYNIFLSV